MDRYYPSKPLARAFFWRRLQSFAGLFLILFLMEHLLTNSQASLYSEDGNGFIRAVNNIRDLPYLSIIEVLFIAFPFLIHMLWGIKYLFTSKQNAYFYNGHTPYLPKYARNHAYTWQRITSWILLIGVTAHVVHMRFYYYPTSIKEENAVSYVLPVTKDPDLVTLSKKFGVKLLSKDEIITTTEKEKEAVEAWTLKSDEVFSVSPDFGTAELLLVRDTFKSPYMVALYTLFLISAVYHAFNGLWTFCITWGITLTARSQKLMRRFSTFLMFMFGFLGMMAIWGTWIMYFVNKG